MIPRTSVSLNDWLGFTARQLEAFQALFTHTYVLYGGARGGGKSAFLRKAAVAWSIYQASKGLPGINMGLFSSTYATLKDRQISKIQSEFPAWLGTLKETKAQGYCFYVRPEWGGAVISLRNLDEPEKYKSAEFGFIAVDELTEHPVETFDILRGSLRWPGLDKPVFVAGTNPDGIGNEWCYNYFIDKKYPDELRDEHDQFIFIQSLPTDNPHLPESYWKMLKTLPDDLRKAWLEGDWKVFKGRAFKEFSRKTHVIPQQEIPAHWTRLIGIDWGYRAPFCALFGARDPDTGRVVIYKEIYESELTDRQQARKILDISDEQELQALRYADPSMWKKATQENVTSTAQIYAQQGCWIRQGENDRLGGKRKVDRMLTNLPDGRPGLQITENVRALPRQLELLVYDPHNTEDVNTRMEDHCLVAETLVKTERGDVPINEVIAGDKVLTRKGYRNVLSSWMESPSSKVIRVSFSDGSYLIGTGNHPVWVADKGWKRLDTLRYGDIINTWNNEAKQSSSTAQSTGDSRIAHTGITSAITPLLEAIGAKAKTICTGIFGDTTTERSPWATRSITKIKTLSTTIFQTLSACLPKNIMPGMKCQAASSNGCASMQTRSDLLLSAGTSPKPDINGIWSTLKKPSLTDRQLQQPVKSAVKNIRFLTSLAGKPDSVQTTAEHNGGVSQRLITKSAPAQPVGKHLASISTQRKNVAPVSVLGLCAEKDQAVYNLEVQGENEFYANGILVHNSYDALRYLLTAAREYQPSSENVSVKGINPYSLLEKI